MELHVAICDQCGSLRALRPDGRVQAHRVPVRVYRRSQWRDKKRRCPGSGQRPRKVEP